MTEQVKSLGEQAGFWAKYGAILGGVLVLIGFLLPPVKRWLNAIPYLWHVLYPLLSLFSLYIIMRAIKTKESVITGIKWCILLVSAVAMTAATYGLGTGLYWVGRTSAIVFIIVELATFIVDAAGGSESA